MEEGEGPKRDNSPPKVGKLKDGRARTRRKFRPLENAYLTIERGEKVLTFEVGVSDRNYHPESWQELPQLINERPDSEPSIVTERGDIPPKSLQECTEEVEKIFHSVDIGGARRREQVLNVEARDLESAPLINARADAKPCMVIERGDIPLVRVLHSVDIEGAPLQELGGVSDNNALAATSESGGVLRGTTPNMETGTQPESEGGPTSPRERALNELNLQEVITEYVLSTYNHAEPAPMTGTARSLNMVQGGQEMQPAAHPVFIARSLKGQESGESGESGKELGNED